MKILILDKKKKRREELLSKKKKETKKLKNCDNLNILKGTDWAFFIEEFGTKKEPSKIGR